MQKVNVDVHIWNELRSNDRFGIIFPPIAIYNSPSPYCELGELFF